MDTRGHPIDLTKSLSECSEDYRWNSLGYHIQIEIKDQFLSTDFGLKEFNPPCMADKCQKSKKERIRRYRRYVYEAGALNRPDKMQAQNSGTSSSFKVLD